MLARALSCGVPRLHGALIEVEVDIAQGLPTFTVVGLPDTALRETRADVRAASRSGAILWRLRLSHCWDDVGLGEIVALA